MNRDTSSRVLGRRSERIAVDSILNDEKVRLLCAKHLKNNTAADVGADADTWEEERELIAYVKAVQLLLREELQARMLRVGDVFIVEDGPRFRSRLRDLARAIDAGASAQSLLESSEPEDLPVSFDESTDEARREIKREYAKLTVGQGPNEKARAESRRAVDEAIAQRRMLEGQMAEDTKSEEI